MLRLWVLCGQPGLAGGGHAPAVSAPREQMGAMEEEVLLCFCKQ